MLVVTSCWSKGRVADDLLVMSNPKADISSHLSRFILYAIALQGLNGFAQTRYITYILSFSKRYATFPYVFLFRSHGGLSCFCDNICWCKNSMPRGILSPNKTISSPPSDAYMRLWIGSALVQIMAWRLFGTKPLSQPILVSYKLDP